MAAGAGVNGGAGPSAGPSAGPATHSLLCYLFVRGFAKGLGRPDAGPGLSQPLGVKLSGDSAISCVESYIMCFCWL